MAEEGGSMSKEQENRERRGRRGIGVGECPVHGEYFLDAEDSPCACCEEKAEERGWSGPDLPRAEPERT